MELFAEAWDEVSKLLQRDAFAQFRNTDAFLRLKRGWDQEVDVFWVSAATKGAAYAREGFLVVVGARDVLDATGIRSSMFGRTNARLNMGLTDPKRGCIPGVSVLPFVPAVPRNGDLPKTQGRLACPTGTF